MKKRHAILAVAMVAGLGSAAWAQGMKGHDGMDMKMNMDKMMPAPSDTALSWSTAASTPSRSIFA